MTQLSLTDFTLKSEGRSHGDSARKEVSQGPVMPNLSSSHPPPMTEIKISQPSDSSETINHINKDKHTHETKKINNKNKYIIDQNGRKIPDYKGLLPASVTEDTENYLRSLEYQYEDEYLEDLIRKFRKGSKTRVRGQWKETVPPGDPYTLYQIFKYAESRKDSGKHFERDER